MRASRFTITLKDSPESVTLDAETFKAVSLQVLRSCPGFRKAYLLSDGAGTVIAMSVWDTEEDMRASEDAVQKLRERFDPREGPGAPTVQRFTVLVEADPQG